MNSSEKIQLTELTPEQVGGKIVSPPVKGEVITQVNPYNHTTWQELVITPEMQIHPNAAIIIVKGQQHAISRACAYAFQTHGSIEIYDPSLQF